MITRDFVQRCREAGPHGIKVVRTEESNTPQQCLEYKKIASSNRKQRDWYRCECGWETYAGVNATANLFEQEFKVSPLRSSGSVAVPVVLPVLVKGNTVKYRKMPPLQWGEHVTRLH
jgi:transposase